MSMAIKASTIRTRRGQVGGNIAGAQVRAALQGDPGLFGFLGDALSFGTKLLRDPVGTVAGLITGSGGLSGGPGNGQVVSNGQIVTAQQGLFQQQQNGGIIDINFPFGGEPGAGVTFFGGRGGNNGGSNGRGPNGECAKGHRLNKSSYFLKDGTFIQEGSRCVKIRRTNPLNPKALSTSIRRINSAKKKERVLKRITIRCPTHGKSSCPTCR